jgi:MFS family permease
MGSIGFAVGSVGYLVGGYLADKLGRKRVVLIGLASTAIGLILFLSDKNLAIYSVAYGFTSLGGSLAWPSMTTLLATKASPSNMKFLYGVQGFVNQIGLTIATFLGIFGPSFLDAEAGIELSTGYLWVFGATAACALVPMLYVARVTEIKRQPERLSLHFDKRMRKILLVYSFQNALIGAGAAFVIPWLPIVFKQGLGATDSWVAFIITVSNIVIAVGWFIIPHFANLRGSVALIAVCQIISVVPMVLIPYSPVLLAVAFLYTVRSLLMLVPSPVLNAYIMNIVDERIRASFLSLSQLAWELAFSASYFVAGYLWANDYSKVEPFYIAGAFYVAASLIFYFYFRNVKEATDAAPHPGTEQHKAGAGAS